MAVSQNVFNLLKGEFKDDVKVTKISESMRGKVITIYGNNSLGKTTNAAKFKNPIFLPCEKGLNATSGAMVLPVTCWADLKRYSRRFSGKKFKKVLQAGEEITLIIDGLERLGNYAKEHLCEKYEVSTIGDANNGYGAWEEYEMMIWGFVDPLISMGYTVVFLGHPKYDKKLDKFVLAGDSRVIKPIQDNSDVVVYLESNGVDENNQVIPSSAYLVETEDFFARTRFTYMDTYIEEFTTENLIKTMQEGIRRQNEAEGNTSVDFEEQQDIYKINETFEEVMEEVKELFCKIKDSEDEDLIDAYQEIVEEQLGVGVKVSEVKPKQFNLLRCVRDELVDLLEDYSEDEE